MLEARYITNDTLAREHASWWLNNISVQRMNNGFNRRYDLLPAGNGGTPPAELLYHAKGTGNLFARTDWSKTATWVARSEERRVGKEFGITVRSRGSPYH